MGKSLMWPLTSASNPANDDRGTSHTISHCISLPRSEHGIGGQCVSTSSQDPEPLPSRAFGTRADPGDTITVARSFRYIRSTNIAIGGAADFKAVDVSLGIEPCDSPVYTDTPTFPACPVKSIITKGVAAAVGGGNLNVLAILQTSIKEGDGLIATLYTAWHGGLRSTSDRRLAGTSPNATNRGIRAAWFGGTSALNLKLLNGILKISRKIIREGGGRTGAMENTEGLTHPQHLQQPHALHRCMS
ncbi:unnamed protein product [Pleuronectes platessa]|uniref:Uncharacterized protein n=1 Tax=Pleuronectes platessa TaxID=8262 RepID=A0A9N7V9Q7_PLEPL|nr:unnamed protein product [Pleuronectes platessa]